MSSTLWTHAEFIRRNAGTLWSKREESQTRAAKYAEFSCEKSIRDRASRELAAIAGAVRTERPPKALERTT